ncbi:MAG: hypothetical protein U0840_12745 [Gemmataceae bacterium]
MSRRTWTALARTAGLTLLVLAASASSRAQDSKENKEEARPTRSGSLIILVRDNKGLNQVEMANTLKRGLELAGCRFDGEVRLRPISSVVFNTLNSVQDLPAAAPERKDFHLQAVPEVPGSWLLSHKRGYTLKDLEVEVETPRKDGKGKELRTRKLTPAFRLPAEKGKPGAASADPPLAMLFPGLYSLRLEPDETLRRYRALFLPRAREEKPWDTDWQKLPTFGDRYYLIVLNNFVGDKKRLFDVIKDRIQVTNPVDDVDAAREFSVVFAAWGMKGLTPGTGFNGFNHTPEIEVSDDRTARVWIRFPLTADEYAAELKKYQPLDSETIIKEIQKDNPILADREATMTRTSKPAWIELSPIPGTGNRRFTRSIALKDVKELEKKYPRVFRLVVWEFKDQAILIQDPASRELVTAIGQEVPEWSRGIEDLAAKSNRKK